jgi:hypothetical protein
VIVALGVERAAFRARGANAAAVIQSGPGPERAAHAATAALASGASGLVSFGLAGALREQLEAGVVLLPRRVRTAAGASFGADPEAHALLAAALHAAGIRPNLDDLLSVPAALTTAAEKLDAAADGAVGVDMESAAIAGVAARAGARFVALRVVVDTARDELPREVERWIDERGERRLGAAFSAALRPARWPSLVTLARRYRVARRTLGRLAPLVTDALGSRAAG